MVRGLAIQRTERQMGVKRVGDRGWEAAKHHGKMGEHQEPQGK